MLGSFLVRFLDAISDQDDTPASVVAEPVIKADRRGRDNHPILDESKTQIRPTAFGKSKCLLKRREWGAGL